MLFSTVVLSQTGHIMQGVGAVNMSMGGFHCSTTGYFWNNTMESSWNFSL